MDENKEIEAKPKNEDHKMPSTNKKKILMRKAMKPLIIIVIIAIALYWFKFSPIAVEQYKVKREDITNKVMGTGTLDAKIKMIISSRISGRVEKVLVDQGDKVKADQLVATLDDDQLKLHIAVALANLQTVESAIDKFQKDLEFSKSVLSNSMKIHDRYTQLIKKKVISQEQYEQATEDLETAIAKNSRVEAAIIEAKNKAIESKQTLKLRKIQLDDSLLRVPFDGIITERERDPGNIVVPGSAILYLISTDVLWVRAWVGETELSKVKIGQPASVVFRSEPTKKYLGKVARIAIEVDKETREFIVDVTVEKLPVNWAIGQRAEVYIKTANKKNVLTIPIKYIKWRKGKSGVFIDNKGVASWTPIEIGVNGQNRVEIIDGVKAGDILLTPVNKKNRLINNSRIYHQKISQPNNISKGNNR